MRILVFDDNVAKLFHNEDCGWADKLEDILR